MSNHHRFDKEVARRFANVMINPQLGCAELRIFHAQFNYKLNTIIYAQENFTVGGHFDNLDYFVSQLARVQGTSCYLTVNPVKSEFLLQSRNDIKSLKKGYSCTDEDITLLRNFYIDIDPIRRPKGISSTRGELDAALERRDKILADFPELVGSSFWGCSGNGAYILIRTLEYPNDDKHRGLFEKSIKSVSKKYSDKHIEVDIKTRNPSRVMCVPGTMKCKGIASEDRPWRIVTIDGGYALEGANPPVPFDLTEWHTQHFSAQPTLHAPPRIPPREAGRHPREGEKGDDLARILERAEQYIYGQGFEDSVQGQDGSGRFFYVACCLVQGFDLSFDDAFPIARRWSEAKSIPPWSDDEIRHKLEDAAKKPGNRPRGYLKDAHKPGYGEGYPGQQGHQGQQDPPHRPDEPRDDAVDAADGDDDRPKVVISTQEHETVAQAIEALKIAPRLFHRADMLVTVVESKAKINGVDFPNPVAPRIKVLPKPSIREMLTRHANVGVYKKSGEDDYEFVSCHPRDWLIDMIATRGEWEGIPYLDAVVESPVIRRDGTVLDTRGYDPSSFLFFESPNVFLPTPSEPTKDDALRALMCLLEIVEEFPFCEEIHRASWLASVLTMFARFAINGPCPLFLFNGNTPGCGKSKLCDVVSLLTTGRESPRTVLSPHDDEMRKRVTALALAAERMVLIDNMNIDLGGQTIDAATTSWTWKDRLLNYSEMTPEIIMRMVWFATGNNVQIKGDVRRRIIMCDLRSKYENPEERKFKHGDLMGYIVERRPEFVRAALTILRAFFVAGCPQGLPIPMGSFEGWSRIVRNCVHWITGYDVVKTQAELKQHDPEVLLRKVIVEGWLALERVQRKAAEEAGETCVEGLTVSEAIERLEAAPYDYTALREALLSLSRRGDMPSPSLLGQKLSKLRNRVVNSDGDYLSSLIRDGRTRWTVLNAQTAPVNGYHSGENLIDDELLV